VEAAFPAGRVGCIRLEKNLRVQDTPRTLT
jgi:hypothetical protein